MGVGVEKSIHVDLLCIGKADLATNQQQNNTTQQEHTHTRAIAKKMMNCEEREKAERERWGEREDEEEGV